MRFAASMDASGIRKGAAEAIASLKSVTGEAGKTVSALDTTGRAFRKAAEESGYFYDRLGRLHAANGKYASSAQKAAIQTKAVGSSSEKAAKQMQGFGSGSDSASKSLAHASSVADALNKRLASLTSRVLATYSAYKLLQGVVAATNVGIQANAAWESQKLSIASIISSTNSLADAQGRVLEGAEKFAASQQVAEKLMQRIQQLGLETTATTQELVTGFQAIIAPALKAGYALEEIPELATRAAQAMGAFQIPIQQMRTEVEALLSGNINRAQDLLAGYLNVSGKMIKEWKQQGILVEEINKRLESFRYSGEAIANTWAGLVSNTREYVEFISRGSTDGLFRSMKSSVRELQSLMITMNGKTGLAEVSSKVDNLTEAWSRLNDFIGNKVLVSTMKFADWIERLNRPENLAELERQVETLWNDFSGIASTVWEVAKAAGEIGKTALDGFNSLPQWAQEIGIIGGLFFGIRGKLVVAGIAYLVEISKNLDSSLSKLQSMEGNESLAYNAYGDFTQEYEASQEKIRTASSSTADSVKNDLNSVADTAAYVNQCIGDSIRSGLEAQMKAISAEIEAQRKIYEEFSEFAYSNQIEDYPAAQESAFQKAEDARQKMESLNESLENVTYQLSILSENAFSAAQNIESIGWGVVSLDEHQPTQLNAAIADLSLTTGAFNLNLLETKNRIEAINGSKAVVEFEIKYDGQQAPKDVFERVWGEGNSSVSDWLLSTLGALDNVQDGITATSSLAGKAGDDGIKKARQIESALHSVESELNRLQMTDAQFKQWQVTEKVAKLEKLLGTSNPKVIELRAALEKELHDNILKDILSYADPAAAAVAKVDKEYQDFLSDIEVLKKSDPARYTQLMAKAETEHEKALRKATRAGKEQADHTQEKLTFYKELEELTGQYGLSLQYQNELLAQQIELWRDDADIPEEYINKIRELRELQMSRDWVDGAKRGLLEYRASASDTAKGVEESFKGLFDGMDSGWKSAWQQMIETGKMSLSSFRSLFASFLADLLHMAITRPVTVQIAGVVSGMFGAGGVAQAAGGAGGAGGSGGLLGNIPFSSLLPDSITGGVSSFLSYELPGTAPGISGLYGPTMSGGNLASGLSLGSSLMYGGFGSLGYSLLGGALGLPQNKYSGITSGLGGALGAWGASAALSGTALGATLGSAVPIIGTAIGALAGGALSSLFGGKKPKRPAVWGGLELDLGDAEAYREGSYDFGVAFDSKGYGRPDFEVSEGGYYAVASRDREKAGAEASRAMNAVIRQVADSAVEQARQLQSALPQAYASQFAAGLSEHVVKASYDLKGDDINEDRLKEIAADLQARVADAMLAAFQGMDFSDYAGKISVDQSSVEGLTKFTRALAVVDETLAATKELREPTSEWVRQAKAAVARMDAWKETMQSTGVTADYAASLMDDYRTAMIDDFIKTLDESLHPLSDYARAMKDANDAVDQRKSALETLGASEERIAQVEAMRAQVVARATNEMLRSFNQDVEVRRAELSGGGELVRLRQQQENERREILRRFGEDSEQYAEILRLQQDETASFNQQRLNAAYEAAKSEYDSYLSQMRALEGQRVQARQQAIQEEISSINEQLNAAKTLQGTWDRLTESLRDSRYNLWSTGTNLDVFSQRETTEEEFNRLYDLTKAGDAEAAGRLSGVGNTLLSLYKQTASGESDYLDAFHGVDRRLKDAQGVAGEQLSAAERQMAALNEQITAQNAALSELQTQSLTLFEIDARMGELKPLLEAALAAKNAAQNAVTNAGGSVPSEKTMAQILREKAEAMNRGETLAPGQTAGGWTVGGVLEEIYANGLTPESWYKKYGKPEGFATGGITPRNRPFIVGEEGPELMMSPERYGVLSNPQTRELLMPAVGTDGDARAMIVQLREQNARLERQNRILEALLTEAQATRGNTGKTADSVENIVRTGIYARTQ